MGIRMVRQPSETPNVTNIDDIIPFRYAYGDQNGYVIGKGTEISHTIDGNTFRINSGRIVLQGVETDIDANGVSFTIDNSAETRYFVVYYEVNLATQTTAIKLSAYSTSGYPTIDAGDDLTVNSSGIARMPLYRFTATNSVISNVEKVSKSIQYSMNVINGEFEKLQKNFSSEQKTQFGSYVFSKKKLIWIGNEYINNSAGNNIKEIYFDSNIVDNDVLEFEYGFNANRDDTTDGTTVFNKIKIKIGKTIYLNDTQDLTANYSGASISIRHYSAKVEISSNKATIYLPHYITGNNVGIAEGIYIKSIHKIIE